MAVYYDKEEKYLDGESMKDSKQPLISVIVPVFNVACFLEECISSIINQTICDLQIILIDDGSTDSSGSICDQFAERDKRILVIHQTNAGVSAARNVGIREAKGKYISFIDADDMLPKDAYKVLLDKTLDCPALAMGRMQKISENGVLLEQSREFYTEEIGSSIFLKDLLEERKFTYLGFLWDKLFLHDVIEKNGLLFNQEIKLNEDRLFILQYMFYVKKVFLVNNIVYYYRQRSNGIISITRRNSTVTDSEMTVIQSFKEMQKVCRDYSKELYFICGKKAFESALDLLNRVSKKDTEKRKILKKFLRENSHICLENPQYRVFDRLKIIGHTILGK